MSDPVGGSVEVTGLGGTGGRYSTSTTLSVAFAPGTDAAGDIPDPQKMPALDQIINLGDGTANDT